MEAAAKKPKVGNDLTQGSIYKTLIVFAVPIILTNLIQHLNRRRDCRPGHPCGDGVLYRRANLHCAAYRCQE